MLQGEARALAALGEVRDAVALERRAIAQAHRPAVFEPWLLEDPNGWTGSRRPRAWPAGLTGQPPPIAPAIYPDVPAALVADLDPILTEDFIAPVSIGTDELTPVMVRIGPSPGGASAELSDLDFIPVYRPSPGLGGESRWCPDWSRRVDLLLAGRPSQTLSGFPAMFYDLRTGQRCTAEFVAGGGELPALADLGSAISRRREPGQSPSMSASVSSRTIIRTSGATPAICARRRGHAQWARLLPNDPLAPLRTGEIAFLRGRYEDAVLAFQAAVRTARRSTCLWSHDEAQALLDEGAALAREGRRAEAVSAFSAAETTAAEWLAAFSAKSTDLDAMQWPPYISYMAQVQIGDAELAGHDYARATEAYRAASDEQRQLSTFPAPPIQARVLANNRAIAELKNGDPAVAVTLAASAVGGDPANPIFHSTEAWALQRLGRWSAAVAEYRTAVALDPTTYPAENDLGVLLMQRHRYAQAADALRRAVGADPRYALGWFNLGVALGHLGPLHYPASQGSLGRAGQLDPRLQHHPPVPVFDDVPYVNEPRPVEALPAHWTFADTQRQAPIAAAGLAAILLLGLGLARALLSATAPVAPSDGWRCWTRRWRASLQCVWIREPSAGPRGDGRRVHLAVARPEHRRLAPRGGFRGRCPVLAAVAFEIRVPQPGRLGCPPGRRRGCRAWPLEWRRRPAGSVGRRCPWPAPRETTARTRRPRITTARRARPRVMRSMNRTVTCPRMNVPGRSRAKWPTCTGRRPRSSARWR